VNPSRQHLLLALATAIILALALGGGTAAAAPFTNYSNTVFSDGFETGSLAAWSLVGGNGSITASTAAAHSGSSGVRLTNVSGQYGVLAKNLASPAKDSATEFWFRAGSGAGFEQVAQARDASSSQMQWGLMYDGGSQAFWFFPRQESGGPQIFTGGNSVPSNTWVKVRIDYTATATGGAQLYINGQTQSDWAATGDFTRSADYQILQLWNDGPGTSDFDDVSIATPGIAAPPAATVPGAPSGVQAAAADGSWT